MNEQIANLAKQAGFIGSDLSNTVFGTSHETALKNFAELIVQECCNMANEHIQINNPNDCLLVLNIKEHFGVTE